MISRSAICLKKIYIDNFKCLVNFELAFDSINLFLGPNGVGKSSVFDVLRKIKAFVGGVRVADLFRSDDLTRWQTSPIQTFELEIEGNNGTYKYELAIDHEFAKGLARVNHERLWFDNKPLLKFESSGEAHLFRDDHSLGPTYPFDWNQSAIAALPERHDNTRLTWFKKRMQRLIIAQINPLMMGEYSDREEAQLSDGMENFVSWYRYISQNQGKAIEITTVLRKVLDGFNHFQFVEAGEQRRLLLNFSGDVNKSIDYRFNELSDGQRVLIALYTLIYYAQSEDYTLCIDEPENFIALPEIQPWLMLLRDFCEDDKLQCLLISHHPELIDRLAVYMGYWFDCESNRPIWVKRITEEEKIEGGVSISELVARGWLYG